MLKRKVPKVKLQKLPEKHSNPTENPALPEIIAKIEIPENFEANDFDVSPTSPTTIASAQAISNSESNSLPGISSESVPICHLTLQTCERCGKILEDTTDLERHNNYQCPFGSKMEEIKYSCPICGDLVLNSDALRYHKKQVHPEHFAKEQAIKKNSLWKWDKCGKTFKLKWDLKQHVFYHCKLGLRRKRGVGMLECEVCGKISESWQAKYLHMSTQHN